MGRRLNTAQGLRPKKRVGISTTVVKCAVCGLIYSDPLPIPRSIEDHYGLVPEDYWRPEYFDSPNHGFSGERHQFKMLAPHAKTFLDIGCGVGKTMKAMQDAGYESHGIEGSRQFYERAIQNSGNITHTTFEAAEYPDGSFDIISFGAVLEHLYDPSAAIEKALKWLTPEGVVHLEVPDANFLFSKLFNLYFWLARTDFVVNISPMHTPFHLYEFTEESFRHNGKRLGYKIAHLDKYAGAAPMVPRLSKLLEPVMDATGTGSGLILYLQHN
jgi:SAM-dependent methyltransferase